MLAHSYRQPAHRFCLLADIVVLESTTGGHVLLSNMGPRSPHTPAIRFQHNRSADAVIDILMALSLACGQTFSADVRLVMARQTGG